MYNKKKIQKKSTSETTTKALISLCNYQSDSQSEVLSNLLSWQTLPLFSSLSCVAHQCQTLAHWPNLAHVITCSQQDNAGGQEQDTFTKFNSQYFLLEYIWEEETLLLLSYVALRSSLFLFLFKKFDESLFCHRHPSTKVCTT